MSDGSKYLRGPIPTDILYLCELRICDDLPCRISRVRSQDDRGPTTNLIRDLGRMDMVIIFLRQRGRYGCELHRARDQQVPAKAIQMSYVFEKREHFLVAVSSLLITLLRTLTLYAV